MTSTFLQQAVEAPNYERLVNAYGNAEHAHASAVYTNAPAEVIAARQRLVFEAHAALLSALQQQPEPVAWRFRLKGDPRFSWVLAQVNPQPKNFDVYELQPLYTAPPALQQQEEPREVTPPNSLPDWYECQRILDNADFRKRAAMGLEGSVLDTPPGEQPTELHRFIYEYDDSDAYRSAWFMHRLELLLNEVRASPSPQDFTLPMVEEGKGADGAVTGGEGKR